jgi:hypothetical protein
LYVENRNLVVWFLTSLNNEEELQSSEEHSTPIFRVELMRTEEHGLSYFAVITRQKNE